MEFTYFDTERIWAEAETGGQYHADAIAGNYNTPGFNHRWIQPPQAAYFVSTLDERGNANLTPVTMGTAMHAPEPDTAWFYGFQVFDSRDAAANLRQVPECVIAYIPCGLLRESWIAGLPLPRGISEVDVAGLTPLPSRKVRPSGVRECPVNLEARVVQTVKLAPAATLFLCKVVAVHVHQDLAQRDAAAAHQTGLLNADLLYEVVIDSEGADRPPRLCYTRMNLDPIYRSDADLGDDRQWIGTFDSWMESEARRGRITGNEREALTELGRRWQSNPDPAANRAIRDELTDRLREVVRRRIRRP